MSEATVRIGVLSFSDGRKRVHDMLREGILEHERRIVNALLAESCTRWPHVFVWTEAPVQGIISKLHANHIHAVEGDCMRELELFARLVGVRFVAA